MEKYSDGECGDRKYANRVCEHSGLSRVVTRVEASEGFEQPYQRPVARSFDSVVEEYNRRHPEDKINRMTAYKEFHRARAKIIAALLGDKPVTRNSVSALCAV